MLDEGEEYCEYLMNGRACGTRQTCEEIIHPPQGVVKRKVILRPETRSRNRKEDIFEDIKAEVKISMVH